MTVTKAETAHGDLVLTLTHDEFVHARRTLSNLDVPSGDRFSELADYAGELSEALDGFENLDPTGVMRSSPLSPRVARGLMLMPGLRGQAPGPDVAMALFALFPGRYIEIYLVADQEGHAVKLDVLSVHDPDWSSPDALPDLISHIADNAPDGSYDDMSEAAAVARTLADMGYDVELYGTED